jgi:HAD superfamily hydrolase (TIGR01459 family)
MTNAVARISGLSAVAGRYRGFIVDLWGVIHDGARPYPGAVETLAALKAAGTRVLLLSNAPRRAALLERQLADMGIARQCYDALLSSGEAVHQALERRDEPVFAALGERLYHLGPADDRSLFEDLPYRATSLDEADFVLNIGPWEVGETVDDYLPVMRAALARHLPMVCANPDHVVIRQGRRVVCAGALAARYAELGGLVVARGKPDPAIYDEALRLLGALDRRLVCAVGDSLPTDIRGANGAGLDSVWVTGGIHAEELGIRWGEAPTPERLAEVMRYHGDAPTAAAPKFVW